MDTAERYKRQLALAEIGPEGQAKIGRARVLVIGAGGLGCPALLYLAGAGVGALGIADFDRVDISNLQRQILYKTDDAGRPKAAAAMERLAALNPEIDINAFDKALSADNAPALFSSYDIIIDGTDNFVAKFLINDAAIKTGKPVVYGAVQGFDGQVAVFGHAGGPCYRCLYPAPPQAPVMNCAEAGVLGAVAGLTGTVQALEALKIITGHESFAPLSGKLWLCDGKSMQTRIISIPKNPDCPVCSKKKEDITMPKETLPSVTEVTANDDIVKESHLLDVREQDEWEAGHIANAQHLPLSRLQENPALFETLRIEGTCVLYCQKGIRSRRAAEILIRNGYGNIYSLAGGYAAWPER